MNEVSEARLQVLEEKIDDIGGVPLSVDEGAPDAMRCLAQLVNAVPWLIAEIRRLRGK